MKKRVLILIVEDEKILANTLKERLISEGFEVEVAYDGLEGFQKAIIEHPDLILLDILMPKVDGLSMLKKIREDTWGSKAKIIVLSNLSDTRSLAEGINIGLNDISDYIVKTNFSLNEIIERIKKILETYN